MSPGQPQTERASNPRDCHNTEGRRAEEGPHPAPARGMAPPPELGRRSRPFGATQFVTAAQETPSQPLPALWPSWPQCDEAFLQGHPTSRAPLGWLGFPLRPTATYGRQRRVGRGGQTRRDLSSFSKGSTHNAPMPTALRSPRGTQGHAHMHSGCGGEPGSWPSASGCPGRGGSRQVWALQMQSQHCRAFQPLPFQTAELAAQLGSGAHGRWPGR